MPTPELNETRSDFITRCIPIVLTDGTARNPAQAVAVCTSVYDRANKIKQFENNTLTNGKELQYSAITSKGKSNTDF
jgi:hypothetical protein